MARQPLTYCGQTVRDYDRDRFLLSLIAPRERREDLWALFAFNHEIAKTREVVTETQLGLIRLQWWRDNIAALYEGKEPFGNPVLIALASVIKNNGLPQDDFEALLYAREFDLEGATPSGMAGLENYADFTTTPLHRMACGILREVVDEKIVRDVATGYALIGLLRAIPFHESQGRRYVPEGVALPDIVARAAALLKEGTGRKGFTGAAAALGLHHAVTIEECGFDVSDAQCGAPPISFILKAFFNRF